MVMKNLDLTNLSNEEIIEVNRLVQVEIVKRLSAMDVLSGLLTNVAEHSQFGLVPKGVGSVNKQTKRRKRSKTAQVSKGRTQKVPARYQSPDGANKWSGRGRTPIWVKDLCADKGLDLAQFKDSPLYKV